MFVDRDEELDFLSERLSQPDPQLLVLYGRRRVGKTRLVNRYLEQQDEFDDSVYYLADERGTDVNVDRLAEEAAESLDDIKNLLPMDSTTFSSTCPDGQTLVLS